MAVLSASTRWLWSGLAACAVLLGLGAAGQSQGPSEAVVSAFADVGLQAVEEPPERAAERMLGALRDYVDVPFILERVIGEQWDGLEPAKRRRLRLAYEQYLAAAFVRRIATYDGETQAILGSRTLDDGDDLVAMAIDAPDGHRTVVQWRVRDAAPTGRIVDLLVDGVSMMRTQREEVAAFLRLQGKDVDALADAWQARRDP